jgi:hypothetical protein
MQMRARNLDELATKLRRPPTGLSAFKELTPDQIGLLSDLIDDTLARRRRAVHEALARAIPPRPVRAALLAFLRRRPR